MTHLCIKCKHKIHAANNCSDKICDAAGDLDWCPCGIDWLPCDMERHPMPSKYKRKTKVKLPSRFDSVLPMSEVKKLFHGSKIPITSIKEIIADLEQKQTIYRPSREEALQAVKTLITYIGDNPNRPGLEKTPERVIKAWEQDWGRGYSSSFIAEQTLSILGAEFDDGAENYNQMISVKNIKFTSHCEHHLAEFNGYADIAYIPSKEKAKILGLSKLARIVNMFSKRLQVQERLTNQIAEFLQIHCKPQGVGVVIKAKHSCMCSRGVRQDNPLAITSALRGDFLTDPAVRAEFLALTRG